MSIDSWITSHKQQALMAGGGVAVAGYALYRRRQSATAAQTAPAVTAAAGLTAPNNSLADIQSAVQDQVNQDVSGLQTQVSQQLAALAARPPAKTTPPGTVVGAAAAHLRYVQDRATGVIYQVHPGGSFSWVTAQQYAALGRPSVVGYGAAKPTAKPATKPPRPAPKRARKPAPKPPKPAPKPKPRPAAPRTYTIRPGDNLSAIARRYGTTATVLYDTNHRPGGGLATNRNPNLIYPGQKIIIPIPTTNR